MKTQLLTALLFTTFLGFSQASLVKDITLGPASGNPQNLIAYNNALLFSYETGGDGNELWISNDGTSIQTFLLSDINSTGSGIGSDPQNFVAGSNRIYFVANDGITGAEVWWASASTANLQQDYYNGPQGSNVTEMLSGNNSKFFVACNPFIGTVDYGTEIVNLTAGTVTEIAVGALNGEPENLYFETLDGNLYFSGNNQTGTGKELYVWGGFAGPATMIIDLNPSGDSNPNHFVNLNDKIYFSANDGNSGNEFYELDYASGNQVTLIKDIKTGIIGGVSSDPGEKIIFNNKIYFAARSTLQGRELWESDGTSAGTQLVLDLNPGTAGSFPENLIVHNNRLYFTATTPGIGLELFYLDSAGNIVLGGDVATGNTGSNPQDLTMYNGKLYFSADDGVNGRELWETSGTPASTIMTANIHPTAASNPMDLVVSNDLLFFTADDGSTGKEVWKYLDPTLSIDLEEFQNVALVPNPVTNGFSVKGNLDILNIDVYDIHGKHIKSFEGNMNFYKTEELTSGVYFVKILTAKGSITKKLLKQ